MLTDEKKKELIEKLGVSEEEFAELVKRKGEEKNVSPGGATLLLYYEAFNKPKGVDTTLEISQNQKRRWMIFLRTHQTTSRNMPS